MGGWFPDRLSIYERIWSPHSDESRTSNTSRGITSLPSRWLRRSSFPGRPRVRFNCGPKRGLATGLMLGLILGLAVGLPEGERSGDRPRPGLCRRTDGDSSSENVANGSRSPNCAAEDDPNGSLECERPPRSSGDGPCRFGVDGVSLRFACEMPKLGVISSLSNNIWGTSGLVSLWELASSTNISGTRVFTPKVFVGEATGPLRSLNLLAQYLL